MTSQTSTTASSMTIAPAGSTANRPWCYTSSRTPDANVVKTVDDILAVMPQLERWIPPAIKVHVVYDRTLLIRAAITDVQFTMMVAHRPGRAGDRLVPAPVSGRPSFPASPSRCRSPRRWWRCISSDFSLDNISLMALTIADRLRDRRRRHHHRKHHAPDSGRRDTDRCGLEGNAADGLHGDRDHLSLIAASHPDPVHAGHRRPSVSRIRRDAGGSHRCFGHRVPDADADDVRPASRHARAGTAGPH